jgi:C4-dicarboxylate transporter DctM subunit
MNVFRRLGKAVDTVSSVYCYIGMTLSFLIGFAIVIDLIIRRFGVSQPWVYFIATVIIATIPFWTSAYGMRYGLHVRVTVLENLMPPQTRLYSQAFGFVFFLVFCAVCMYQSLLYMLDCIRTNSLLIVVVVPEWPLHLIVWVGLLILCLQIITELVRVISRIPTEKNAGKYFWGKPYFILPVYALAAFALIYLFWTNPVVGAFALVIGFLFLAMPIAASIGFVTLIALFKWGGWSYMAAIGPVLYGTMEDYTWLAFPLFVLAGFMMQRGMAGGLFKMASSWLGWIPGGLAIAVIWVGVALGAMLGSIYATVATMFVLAIAELDRRGYKREFTLPMMASSAVLGYLIPPSISLVIWGVLTEQSIGALFMSGIGPGLTLAVVFSVFTFLYFLLTHQGERVKASWKERFISIPPNILALMVPVIVIGGMTIKGVGLTPTEAAAVAMVYVFVVNMARGYTKFNLQEFKSTFDSGANVIGFMALLIVGALLSKYALVQYEAGKAIVSLLTVLGESKLAIFVMMTFILFLMGCIGEMFPIIIILIPTIFPVLYHMGMHPWWLCVYLVLMGGLGSITPPVGGVLFAVAGMARVDPYFIFRRVIPWCIMFFVTIIILYAWPWLVTWIPLHTGFSQPPGF